MRFVAAVVQLTSTADVEASVTKAEELVAHAAQSGAQMVLLPENTSFMGPDDDKRAAAEPIGGQTFARMARLAQTHQLWLFAGTLPESPPSTTPSSALPMRVYNTSVVFSPDGRMVAHYRKIHLFDIDLGPGATFKESESVAPGSHITLAHTPLGKIGLSVCYDLRFPGLYRALVDAGAQILTVPAAFTIPTGRDHWEVLLRARAIENQCYVLAAGQVGQNTPTRSTFGRSMIIDPWGTVLATAPDRPSIVLAEIDLEHLATLRQRLPCLSHERRDSYHIE